MHATQGEETFMLSKSSGQYAYCACICEMELCENVKAASVNLLDIYIECYITQCQVLLQ